MIGKTLGHYEISNQLGKGGMGEVYRARDTKLNRDVALKILPAEFANDIGDAMSLLEGVPESAPPKRPRIAWSIAALAVLIAAVFAYMHFREKAPTEAEKRQFSVNPSVKLAPYGSLAVSPNGRYLAFAGLNSDGVPCLWVHDFQTDHLRQLPGTESSILPPFF
jgi:serine/threonine protein kinase